MIWLASYPRSGNTYFRIVLHEVYGIESSTFHLETDYPLDKDYDKYLVVKTHLLPNQLVPADPNIPAVYLVRDGRDCIISMAHQRITFIDPKADYYELLREGILAAGGSYFGGWSNNVRTWLGRAAMVIKFEDLIRHPVKNVEKLRAVMDLPKPNLSKVPDFHDLKTKDFPYGSGLLHGAPAEERKWRRGNFFRRGKAGAWKDEMPDYHLDLFWEHHGETMEMLGYKKWDLSTTRRRMRKYAIEKGIYDPATMKFRLPRSRV